MTQKELARLVAVVRAEIDKMLRERHSPASRQAILLQLGRYLVAIGMAELEDDRTI